MTEQAGTNKSFNLPVDEIIEFALEGIGGETISAKETKLARTALNLVIQDIQIKLDVGPLSSVEEVCVDLASGSANAYQLSADVLNIHHAVIRTSVCTSNFTGYLDIPMYRESYDGWMNIPTKEDTNGRPTVFFIERKRDNLQVSFWPRPNKGNYSFYAWATKAVGDVDASYQLVDMPKIYLNTLIKGLRYYMAYLREVSPDNIMLLKQEYYESLQEAGDFDRERVDFELYPDVPPVMR